jgi:hypothetical protein
MFRRAFPLAIAFSAATFPLVAAAQTAPVQYGVCASQMNLQTIYVSGVLQGPASAAASIRAGFTQFLAQRYGYKGAVGCVPAANAVAATKLIQDRASALRNAKKTVIETGWAESAAPAAKLAGMLGGLSNTASQGGSGAAIPTATAATPAAASTSAATGSAGAASGGGSGSSQLTSVLASIFGSGGGSGCAGGSSGKSQAGGTGGGASTSGSSGSTDSSGSSGGCQSTVTQVSSALSSAFSQKSGNGGGSAAGSSQSGHSAADGLGSAQAQNTRLVVYGCGRQDTQVACITDLTNQDKANTLVQSADLWKDAFIVDDRGDRHQRSRGFFLNIDGDQRTQLDISYNKSARFIIMFDDVQAKVQKVSLRSKTGGLDVEDITLITSGTGSGTASGTASGAASGTASNTASDGSH